MWMLALTAALAQSPEVDRAFEDAPDFDDYRFEIAACDGIRAQVIDDRPPVRERADELFVHITNRSDQTCLYRGVVLKGAIEGTYKTPQHRKGSGDGFFIGPGQTVRLFITPTRPELPRNRIRLEIAPDKGILLLRGDVHLEAPKATP
jgi:hypothetical protein